MYQKCFDIKFSKKIIYIIFFTFIFLQLIIVRGYASSSEDFRWPLDSNDTNLVEGMQLTENNVNTSCKFNESNANVYACGSGKVVKVYTSESSGTNGVLIEHDVANDEEFKYDEISYGKKLYTRYTNLKNAPQVAVGDIIEKGKYLGKSNTNLFFSIYSTSDISLFDDALFVESKKRIGDVDGNNLNEIKEIVIIYNKIQSTCAAFDPRIIIEKVKIVNQTSNDSTSQNEIITISSGLDDTGNIENLGKTLENMEGKIESYSKVFLAILLFVSVTTIGLALILKRESAKDREQLMSGLLAIGVGSLIVALTFEVINLIRTFI